MRATADGPTIGRHPPALRSGDTVAIVSPCGPVLDHALLDDGIALLRSWGLDVVEGAHVRGSAGHLAGSDAQRVADLNAAIADPDVRAVWVTRGGYGLTRILDRVDWAALAAEPTVIVGFSDVSALLVSAWRRIGLVTVHGHVVGRLPSLDGAPREVVRGPLIGGNLTVLAALAGTRDQVDATGCVLLLEEVGEAPYRVDRLLTQLRHSGAFACVAGIAVGAPVQCDPPATQPSGTFADVLADRLGDLGVPVVTDVSIGHMPDQRAVLHGGEVTLDGRDGTLTSHARLPLGGAG